MTEAPFDSRPDTYAHIARVRYYLNECVVDLLSRGEAHDESKLRDPELALFDEYTPKLADTTYGSDEYKGFLKEMGPALDHHYAHNSHHPEHYDNGVDGMSLVDMLEMLCDWKAASERTKDGNLRASLDHNFERFGISEQLASIIRNTVEELWPSQ